MIIRLEKESRLGMYVDTDFAGLFTAENLEDPISVKLRSGIILTFRNVPIHWSSKFLTEIALLTLEAEYIAFS